MSAPHSVLDKALSYVVAVLQAVWGAFLPVLAVPGLHLAWELLDLVPLIDVPVECLVPAP